MKVTTKSGFTCDIDKEKLDDWHFAKLAAKATQGGEEALQCTIYLVDHMLTEKDAERLEAHVKTKDGRVPTTKMVAEVTEILNLAGEKN